MKRRIKLIGSFDQDLDVLVERAEKATGEGFTSLIVLNNGGFHSFEAYVYASKGARKIRNPRAWIAKAQSNAADFAAKLWAATRGSNSW